MTSTILTILGGIAVVPITLSLFAMSPKLIAKMFTGVDAGLGFGITRHWFIYRIPYADGSGNAAYYWPPSPGARLKPQALVEDVPLTGAGKTLASVVDAHLAAAHARATRSE